MSRREKKALATRATLIDATFECLVECGYHGTTTVAVCERSGLARGTMLYHFPTKQSLVTAAIEDVLIRRAAVFRSELSEARTADLGTLVRHLWGAVRGPTFMAWLELAIASRTDAELEVEFRSVMGRFDVLVTQIAEATLPARVTGDAALEKAVSLVFTALNGLALEQLQSTPERVEGLVDELVRWVQVLDPI